MKNITASLFFLIALALASSTIFAQAKDAPKYTKAEADANNAIVNAVGVPAKLKLCEDFIKKNPKSQLRSKLASYLSQEIETVTDGQQRLAVVEQFGKIFNTSEEQDLVLPAKVDGLAIVGKTDEAFKLAPKVFQKDPDSIFLYTQLALKGSNEVRQGKMNFADPSWEYGTKAVKMMEENKRPNEMDEKYYNQFKTQFQPELYQALGFIAFQKQDFPTSKSMFEKNVALNPKNGFGYLMLAEITNGDYQRVGMQFNSTTGPERDKLLKQAEALMDTAIDLYAHTMALADGNAQMQPIVGQITEQLQQYWKFRHGGKLDGLQQLIDKYKK